MPVPRLLLSGEALLQIQPYLHSAGAGAQWAPLSTDRAGRRDPERSGDRTRRLHERMILRHARFPVSHLGIVVQEKGFEPSKLCY